MTQPDNAKRPFKLHLPGLLKVLAEHLYSTKKVALRELIQNAHDSCNRRAVEAPDRYYRPVVKISTDPERELLIIEDNGSGLTEEEINDYLSTIGRSYTRELTERLSIMSPEKASELIGQFGLGFLSAFLIATEVRVISKSHKADSQAVQWLSSGDEYYEVSAAERSEIGTRLEITVKASAAFVFQEQVLIDTVRQYADFLPIPILVGLDKTPVNLMTPPWEASDPEQAAQNYIERTFNTQPITIIQLHDQTIDLGHDTMVIPLSGFLFVPPYTVGSIREYGDLNVYIKRMFIRERERDLMPPWARFVRGVVDCPYLQPTASREGIHQDDTFLLVQQAIETQLVHHLTKIADEDPLTWRKIVRGHTDVIVSWAIADQKFFEKIADIVTIRTSRGNLTITEYLKLTDNTLYFVKHKLGSLQEQLLAEGHDVPVIDGSYSVMPIFLEIYAASRKGVKLVQLDGESEQLMRSVSEDDYGDLLNFYRQRGIRARMMHFKPIDVPAIMHYPQDAEFIMETREALDAGELPGPLAGLVSDYLDGMAATEEDLKGTLYINAGCSLIQVLTENPPETTSRDAVLILLYQVARLFAGRTLTASDATAAFRESVKALEGLLGKKA